MGRQFKKNQILQYSAVISEVEPFTRNNKQYFKISLFVGYGDETTIEGDFVVTPNTKCLETAGSGSTVITVDSTIGFGVTGTIFSGTNEITYTSKSINQFFGCSGIVNTINSTDNILSDQTYFGYEDGDTIKSRINNYRFNF